MISWVFFMLIRTAKIFIRNEIRKMSKELPIFATPETKVPEPVEGPTDNKRCFDKLSNLFQLTE